MFIFHDSRCRLLVRFDIDTLSFCSSPFFKDYLWSSVLLVCSNLTWIIAFDRGTLDHLNQVYDLVDPSLDANMQC